MKKIICLLLCLCLILFIPMNALAVFGIGDRAAIFNPNLSGFYGVVRMDDGSLRALGEKEFEETKGWKNLKYLSFNQLCSVGLTQEGKVLLGSTDGLVKGYRITDALKWKNIVSLHWDYIYLFGIDAQGVLHVTGGDDANRTMTGFHKANGWKNVKQVVSLANAVCALQTDGTVRVLAPRSKHYVAAQEWKDIIQIAGTDYTLFGLRQDGTVVQCGMFEYQYAAEWTDVKMLVTDGAPALAAIKNDGTVVGDDSYGPIAGTESWRNVRKIIGDARNLYAISEEGTLLTTTNHSYSDEWHDLVDIWIEYHDVAALREDGAVLIQNKVYPTREIN